MQPCLHLLFFFCSMFYHSSMEKGTQDTEHRTFTVVTLSRKGKGVAHDQGKEVEIPYVLPGEEVEAVLLKKKEKGKQQASLSLLQKTSPFRVSPRCKHFGLCGGCQWQHLAYAEQLEWKEKEIARCFARLSHVPPPLHAILPSPSPWHYRNKMEYTFSMDKRGNRYLGLMMRSGRGKVFSLEECHLAPEWFADVTARVREWWEESTLEAFHPIKRTGALRYLTLREGRRTGTRMAVITTSGDPQEAWKPWQKTRLIDALQPVCHSIVLRIEQSKKGMPTQYYEMILSGEDSIEEILHIQEDPHVPPISLRYRIAPTAFFQPNTLQAEVLYSQALQMIPSATLDAVYDLYCGTGTLALCLAQKAGCVIGIDLSHEAIVDARENAKRNQRERITFYQGDVGKLLAEKKEEWPAPTLVVVDPPRAGLGAKAIQEIGLLNPPALLYISCNPVTQADDLLAFEQLGYRMTARQAVDSFPHTVHIENIVFMEKRSHYDS